MSSLILTSDAYTSGDGALEYEAPALYFTPINGQTGVILADQYVYADSVYNLGAVTTSPQPLFPIAGTGSLSLAVGKYEFECLFGLTNMSGSSGSFGFAFGGTATIDPRWYAVASKAALATAVAPQVTFNQSTANANLATATTSTVGFARIEGTMIISVAGTLTPQASVTVAAASNIVTGSYFKIRALGTEAQIACGNWV